MRLADKVALITGGSAGIGLATARRFAEEGARVAILGRTEARLDAARAALGGDALAIAADVSRTPDVERAVRAVLDRWGRIDVLVNSAYRAQRPALAHDIPEEEWEQVLRTSLTGYFLTAKAVLPRMMEQRSGAIVMVTSESVQTISPYLAAYSAAKGGATALMKSIAAEYGEYGIRCNCVQAGATLDAGTMYRELFQQAGIDSSLIHKGRRPTNLLGRLGKPHELANVILFLASDEASYVTGAVYNVDGGYTT